MNYQKIYDQIIERARSEVRKKKSTVYYEAHHILPRCLGGEGLTTQWKTHPNIVLLTAREHFLCHWLLARIYKSNRKVVYAFWLISTGGNASQDRYRSSSRTYQEAKESYINSDRTRSEESKKAQSIRMKGMTGNMLGKSHTPETIRKISESNKGKFRSEETRERISKAKKGTVGNNKGNPSKYTHSEETRLKMRLADRKPYKKRASKPRGPYKKKLEI
jgi:hypothetical protein